MRKSDASGAAPSDSGKSGFAGSAGSVVQGPTAERNQFIRQAKTCFD
jgi:hypothetical protein